MYWVTRPRLEGWTDSESATNRRAGVLSVSIPFSRKTQSAACGHVRAILAPEGAIGARFSLELPTRGAIPRAQARSQ